MKFHQRRTLQTVTAIVLGMVLPFSVAVAQGRGGGNGGGGSVGGSSLAVVNLHPAGSIYSYAYRITETGLVVGECDGLPGVWDANTAQPTFVPLSGDDGGAYGASNAGEIVGWSETVQAPVYWADSTRKSDLPTTSR